MMVRWAWVVMIAFAWSLGKVKCSQEASVSSEWNSLNGFLQGLRVQINTTRSASPGLPPFDQIPVEGESVALGSVVTSGQVWLLDVVCDDVELHSGVSLSPSQQASQVLANVNISDLSFQCTGSIAWDNLSVTPFGNYSGVPSIASSGSTSFEVAGSDTDLSTELVWTMGEDLFAGSTTSTITRPVTLSVDPNTCSLSVPSGQIFVTPSPSIPTNAQPLFITLIQALISRVVVCESLSQLAGDGSALLQDINRAVDELSSFKPLDVLASESSLVALVPDASLVDFSASSTAQIAIAGLNDVLSAESGNATGPDLAINGLVTKLTESPDGQIQMNLTDIMETPVVLLNDTVQLDPVVNVSGLNRFLFLDAFKVVEPSRFSLSNEFTFEQLVVSARLVTTLVKAASSFVNQTFQFANRLDVTFDLHVVLPNVTLSLVSAFAVDQEEALASRLGEIEQNPRVCGLRPLLKVNVSSFQVHPDASFSPLTFQFQNFMDQGLNDIAPQIDDLANSLYNAALTTALPNMTMGLVPLVSELVNQALQETAEETCPVYNPDYPAATTLVNFNSSSAQQFRETLDATIANVDDPNVGINKVIRDISASNGDPGGDLILQGPFETLLEFNEASTLSLAFSQVRMVNADSFKYITLFEPIMSSDPGRTIRTSFLLEDTSSPIVIQANVQVKGSGDAAYDEEGTATLRLSSLRMLADLTVNILKFDLFNLPLGQFARPQCLLSLLDYSAPRGGLRIEALQLNVSGIHFDCSRCEFSTKQSEDIAKNIEASLSTFIPLLVERTRTADGSAALNGALQDISTQCVPFNQTSSQPADLFQDAGLNSVLIVNGIASMCLGVFFLVLLLRRSKGVAASRDISVVAAEEGKHAVMDMAEMEMEKKSLFTGYGPRSVKLFAFVLFFVSLGLFLSANLTIGANVEATVTLNDDTTFVVDDIFKLSLTGTITDMFNANIPAIGVIVALMSGCWPYVRLVLSLFCLLISPQLVGASTRGNILSLVDFFGKWAVVDQFLIVTLVAVFDVQVELPAESSTDSLLPQGFFRLWLSLVPSWGIFGFFLGAVSSMLMNHLVTYLHRLHVSPTVTSQTLHSRLVAVMLQRKETLGTHIFEPRVGRSDESRLQMRFSGLKFTTVASTLMAVLLLAVSFFVEIVEFRFEGAGGLGLSLLQAGGEKRSFAIIDLVSSLHVYGDSAGRAIGLVLIQVFFVLTVIVAPLLQQVLLFLESILALKLREQRFLCFSVETLSAWASLDVFLVSVVFSSVYITNFVELAVSKLCKDVDQNIQDWLVPFGVLPAREGACLMMSGSLKVPFIVPAFAACLALVNTYTINSMVRLAMEEREQRVRVAQGDVVLEPGLSERNLGCFHAAVNRHLLLLNKMGLVQVRRVTALAVTSEGSDESDDVTLSPMTNKTSHPDL